MDRYDQIDIEIQWQRLIAIMDEIDNATVKSSFSTIVGESRDFACILVDAKGRSLCQSSFSPPNFCVILPRTVKEVLRQIGADNINEGDVLITNDPWVGTGHLPDHVIMTPVFFKRKIVAFIGTVAHLSDVGGHNGDIEAEDVFTEGIRIPPSKLYNRYSENEELFNIINTNCRVPDLVIGDLRAIYGTHVLGISRFKDFLNDYNLNNIEMLSNAILDLSDNHMKRKIKELKNGTYDYNLAIDGYIEKLYLKVSININDSKIDIDYSGSSKQVENVAINCVYNTTYASSIYPFKCALASNIPNNEGLFKRIDVKVPLGCVLNTKFPSPVQARAKVTNNINQLLFGALTDVFNEYSQAGSGSIWPFSFSGTTKIHGKFSTHMLPHGGRGAMSVLDGLNPIAFPHNSTVTPIEIMETKAPIMIVEKKLIPDSCGAGKYRGGLGQSIIIRNIGNETIKARLRPDKIFCAPQGLNNGKNGKVGVVKHNKKVLTKFPIFDFKPSDIIDLKLPGGGGHGDPLKRSRKLIDDDFKKGYCTKKYITKNYK